MVILRNLLPHDVSVYSEGEIVNIPPSGYSLCVRRSVGSVVSQCTIDGVNINIHAPDNITEYRLTFKGGSIPLPPPRPNMFFIVSQRMARSLWRSHLRDDFLVPMTAPHEQPIRNDLNKIIGVKGFKQV